MTEPLYLTAETMRKTIDLCETERPLEACGFIIGQDKLGTDVVSIPNVHSQPSGYYQMDDTKILDFYKMLDNDRPGTEVLAAFHSHPTTAPIMSNTDIAAARDLSVPYLIVGLANARPSVRAWKVSLRAIGVKTVDEVRVVFSRLAATVEEPDAPYALFPGNYVKIWYQSQRRDEPTVTTATVLRSNDGQIALSPDDRQRSKPNSMPMDRVLAVEVIHEAPGAAALRREMIGHARHLAAVLALSDDIGMAPDLIKAMGAAFPPFTVKIRQAKA